MTSAFGAIEIHIATSEPDFDHVRSLLADYNAFLFDIIDPALLRHRETELDALPGAFAPPRGALLLAMLAREAVGCIGVRPLATGDDEIAAECCRMWVTHAARGRSLGRVLLREAITAARKQGCTALYLNSVPETMAAAYRLYLEFGFVPVAPYKQVSIPGIRFLRLALDKDLNAVQPDGVAPVPVGPC